MTNQIDRMRESMQACGVDPGLIEQAVLSATTADLFAAPVVARISAASASKWFDEKFWPNVPKRDGQNPKEPARKKIIAALISGENPDLILAGLSRLTQGLARRNKIGTEFVPRAITWINGKGWKDDPEPNCPRPPPGPMGFFGAAAHVRSQME